MNPLFFSHLLQMPFISEFSYSNNQPPKSHNYGKTIPLPFSQSNCNIFSELNIVIIY